MYKFLYRSLCLSINRVFEPKFCLNLTNLVVLIAVKINFNPFFRSILLKISRAIENFDWFSLQKPFPATLQNKMSLSFSLTVFIRIRNKSHHIKNKLRFLIVVRILDFKKQLYELFFWANFCKIEKWKNNKMIFPLRDVWMIAFVFLWEEMAVRMKHCAVWVNYLLVF